jgi:hypothetical protein
VEVASNVIAPRSARTARLALVALASLVLVAAQTTPPPASVAFGRAPLPKGVRLVATSSNEQSVKSTVKGGGIEQAVDGTTRVEFAYGVAVTASDEKGTQSGTIELTRAHVHVAMPLGEQDEESPAAGRTWAAKRAGDGWSFAAAAADKDAPPADDETLTTLNAIAARALEPLPLVTLLDGKRLAVGETVQVGADDAKKLLATFAESWRVTSLALKLAAIQSEGKEDGKRETAHFTLKATLAASGSSAAGADATLELSGEMVVATAHSLLLRASLSGPIKIDGKVGDGDAGITIQGTGDAKWTFAAALE